MLLAVSGEKCKLRNEKGYKAVTMIDTIGRKVNFWVYGF